MDVVKCLEDFLKEEEPGGALSGCSWDEDLFCLPTWDLQLDCLGKCLDFLETNQSQLVGLDARLQLALRYLQNAPVNLPISGHLISRMKSLVISCIRYDAGQQQINLITRLLLLVERTDPHFLLEIVLHYLLLNQSDRGLSHEFSLHLTAVLSGRLFSVENLPFTGSLLFSRVFWQHVQAGLSNSGCSLTRKRALFLLKRFTDSFDEVSDRESYAARLFPSLTTALWEDFCLVLETLEEKQVHLVQQILPKVESFLTEKNTLHLSWILIIFTRFFQHQNVIVIKWGLDVFLGWNREDVEEGQGGKEELAQFIGKPLFQVVNESRLYGVERGPGGEVSHYGQHLAEGLTTLFNRLLKTKESSLLPGCINSLCGDVSWGPLPLYWVTRALADISPPHPPDDGVGWLGETELTAITELIDQHMVYQEPVLRGAAQHNLLQTVLLLHSPQPESWPASPAFFKLAHSLWRCRVLLPGTAAWSAVSSFLAGNSNISSQTIEGSVTASLEKIMEGLFPDTLARVQNYTLLRSQVERLALTLYLTLGSHSDCGELVERIVDQVLAGAGSNRAYASPATANLHPEQRVRVQLAFIKALLDIPQLPKKRKGKEFLKFATLHDSETLELKFSGFREKILGKLNLDLVISSLNTLQESDDLYGLENSEIYLGLLLDLFQQPLTSDALLKELCLANMSQVNSTSNASPFSGFIALKILLNGIRANPELIGILPPRSDEFNWKLSGTSTDNPAQRLEAAVQVDNRDDQRRLGKLVCQHTADWLALYTAFYSKANLQTDQTVEEMSRLISLATESLELGGIESLVPALGLVQSAVAVHTEVHHPIILSALYQFVNVSHRYMMEFRKNEVFWPALVTFVHLCLNVQSRTRSVEVDNITSPGQFLVELFVGCEGAIAGLVLTVLEQHLHNSENAIKVQLADVSTTEVSDWLLNLLARGLTFGPSYRRDQRVTLETNCLVSSRGEELTVNLVEGSDHELSHSVRLKSLCLLWALLEPLSAPCRSHHVWKLFTLMKELGVEVQGGRQRHFENSEVHKFRQRMYQTMLILVPLVCDQHKDLLFTSLCEDLLRHSEQTSVRYYAEWSLSLLTLTWLADLGPRLWEWLARAAATRMGAVPSFLHVITNVATSPHGTATTSREQYLDRAVIEVSPWCMAQQYGVRLVAQLSFTKLWHTISREFPNLAGKFEVLNSCVEQSAALATGERAGKAPAPLLAGKAPAPLLGDFYLTVFQFVEHFTLADILSHFPRLCCVSHDEVVSRPLFSELGLALPFVRTENPSSTLAQATPSTILGKDPLSVVGGGECGGGESIQRKITPWVTMLQDSDIVGGAERGRSRDVAYPGLVVIASLIDRPPNLGGLCRSCDILGAGRLVLPSLAVTAEREFTGVSVTAEQWVPLEAVSEADLPQFLTSLKHEGFTIVAVEQATKSEKLQEFRFPAKSALLLGKEREGVPVELLNLVDVCVEIPQTGVIRSFNVHVTGALVMWEYVRQQLTAAK